MMIDTSLILHCITMDLKRKEGGLIEALCSSTTSVGGDSSR